MFRLRVFLATTLALASLEAASAQSNIQSTVSSLEPIETEVVTIKPPDLQLHAVYDESFPVPSNVATSEVVIVMPAAIGYPEVREKIRIADEALAGAQNLEKVEFEDDDFGGVLRLQYDRETGRKLESWARDHLGQRIAVMAGTRLVTAEAVTEGLGRRLLIPMMVPISHPERYNWDGRTNEQSARDQRDEETYQRALRLQSEGKLDWLRRGVSLVDTIDSALDGDSLSNKLLAWLALNSGAEGAQHQYLAEMCWMAARDQRMLWLRLIGQWPDQGAHDQLMQILQLGSLTQGPGDPLWQPVLADLPALEDVDIPMVPADGDSAAEAVASPDTSPLDDVLQPPSNNVTDSRSEVPDNISPEELLRESHLNHRSEQVPKQSR